MFDVEVWDPTNSILLDSFSQFLTITPQPLTSYSINIIGREVSTLTYPKYGIM
jgi:hypothetical protein